MTLRWSRVLAAHEDLLPGDATDHVDGAGVRHASEMIYGGAHNHEGEEGSRLASGLWPGSSPI